MTQRETRSLKERTAAGELTIGSWLSCPYTPICELMARAGFEWLVVDMEHTTISVSEQMQLIQVIELAGIPPLVRVGANDPLLIKRALDAGSHGVIVPMVNSVAEAQAAVDAAHYPPRGQRGVGLARAQAYGLAFDEYRQRAAAETLVVVQIEHIDVVPHLGDILAVDGVDAFIVGPYDLSGSMGHPGDWGHPDVIEALAEVERLMELSPVPGGFHVVYPGQAELRQRIERGYRFIAYGNDMVFLAGTIEEQAGVAKALRDEYR